MKPILLEIEGFGPYKNKEIIDFSDLSRSGIFLIKGPTGSGKTTIFDAMTFALYGGGSGESEKVKNGRNDLSEWRCNQASPETPTAVIFTFEVNGKKYRFTRKMVMARKNLHEEDSAVEIDADGNERMLLENPKSKDMTDKAVEILSLSKEQFRQVILLPQGQFEKFLVANSQEKEAILSTIFDTAKWTIYANQFYAKCESRLEGLKEKKKKIDGLFSECREVNSTIDINTSNDVINLVAMLETAVQQLEKDFVEFDAEKKQNELNDDIALNVSFEQLHNEENQLSALRNKEAEIKNDKLILEMAEKAEVLRPLFEKKENAVLEKDNRNRALTELNKKTEAYNQAFAACEEAVKNDKSKEEANKLSERKGILTGKKTVYENIESKKDAYDEALKKFNSANDKLEKVEKAEKDATEKAANSKISWDKAENTAREFRDRYYANIYGDIASKLSDGDKCPVCGSTNHPSKAKLSEDSVSEAAMKNAQDEADIKKADWDAKEKDRQKAEENKKAALYDKNEAAKILSAAESEMNAAKESLIEGINSLPDLNNEIENIDKSIDKLSKKTEELNNNLKAADSALTKHKTEIEHANNELNSAVDRLTICENELDAGIRAAGYEDVETAKKAMRSDEERKKLSEKIVSYKTSVENLEKSIKERSKALDGVKEPDSAAFDLRQEEINNKIGNFNREKSDIINKKDLLSRKLKTIEGLEKDYYDGITEAETDYKFAKVLRGDTGIGLQRYVLGIMFNQVIGEANRMLSKVHNGRYQLSRSDEKGTGNKRGLELIAHDNRMPDQAGRNVSMLSGGEKFLVSLALSIGMSTVARKSGIKIDALFIDEGFGTLDNSSIQDAIDVLEDVKSNNGMIGIISHVKLLEENIADQLEILKSDEGSRIVKV